MRNKAVEEHGGEVPTWLMTFSDVITLLMTFFILLLTFATDEPEKFQQMQRALFGGAGGTGVASNERNADRKDSMLIRERPPQSRMSRKGSETPPIHSDVSSSSIDQGLSGLDDPQRKNLALRRAITIPLALLLDEQDRVTELGRQRLRMLGRRLRQQPYHAALEVHEQSQVPRALSLAWHLIRAESIPPGKIGVGVAAPLQSPDRTVRIILTKRMQRDLPGATHGPGSEGSP